MNKMLDRVNHVDDLYTLDPELYRNLMSLKTMVTWRQGRAHLAIERDPGTAAL